MNFSPNPSDPFPCAAQITARVSREIVQLATAPPEGIAFLPGDDDRVSEVNVSVLGPAATPYDGGRFQLRLVLGPDFPQEPPRAFFLTKIFHPNVAAKDGAVCVNTLKRDWDEATPLAHILQAIRCLLIVPFPESSLNDEAGKLLLESYDDYAERARVWTRVHARAPASSDRTAAAAAAAAVSRGDRWDGAGGSSSSSSPTSNGAAGSPRARAPKEWGSPEVTAMALGPPDVPRSGGTSGASGAGGANCGGGSTVGAANGFSGNAGAASGGGASKFPSPKRQKPKQHNGLKRL